MPTIEQLEEEREYFMHQLAYAQTEERTSFLEQCLRNNAKRLIQLRNDLSNQ